MNEALTISEIIKKRKELEAEINATLPKDKIQAFLEETGLSIRNIEVVFCDVTLASNYIPTQAIIGVSINVESIDI